MRTMYLAFAPATRSTPIATDTMTDAEPRSGWMMTSTAGAPTIINPPRKREYETSSPRSSARYGRQHEQGGELGHLRRLEVERPEVEGDLVLARRDAEQEQQRQEHEREPVEECRPLLPPFVIEGHHDRHDDHRHDGEHDLAGDERIRVGSDAGA